MCLSLLLFWKAWPDVSLRDSSHLPVAFLRVLDAVDSCRSINHKGGISLSLA